MHSNPGERERARSRLQSAAPALACLAAGLLGLSACTPTAEGTASAAQPTDAEPSGSTEAFHDEADQEQETAAEEADEPVLEALSEEEMLEVLIGPGDLPEPPAGHSTNSGIDYFQEQVAVEFDDYRDRFGPSECASAMDSINLSLVGDGAAEGLLHTYRFADGGESPAGLLYVWALSYDHDVDASGIWARIEQHCVEAPLQNDSDSVMVDTFEAEEFTGVQLDMDSASEEAEESLTSFSATAEVGHNLVMMSSVGLSEDDFRELVQIQQRKLSAAREAE